MLGTGVVTASLQLSHTTPHSLREPHLCPPGFVESPAQLLPKYSPCSMVAIAWIFNMKNGCCQVTAGEEECPKKLYEPWLEVLNDTLYWGNSKDVFSRV